MSNRSVHTKFTQALDVLIEQVKGDRRQAPQLTPALGRDPLPQPWSFSASPCRALPRIAAAQSRDTIPVIEQFMT